jgi:predicted nucleotidyltransferase
MATIQLPSDFREFLKLLNSHDVRYLLIGGYAVNYHGYPRATGDMDIWVDRDPDNAEKVTTVLRQFGFRQASPELFTEPGNVVRMGVSPLRIEVLTTISGVQFGDCYPNKVTADLDGIQVTMISAADLKINKRVAGRLKDLADLEELE